MATRVRFTVGGPREVVATFTEQYTGALDRVDLNTGYSIEFQRGDWWFAEVSELPGIITFIEKAGGSVRQIREAK